MSMMVLVLAGTFTALVVAAPAASAAPLPAPTTSFEGLRSYDETLYPAHVGDPLNLGDDYFAQPFGDVSPDYYVQLVHTSFGVFDKTTGALTYAESLEDLFADTPGNTFCNSEDSNGFNDTMVQYDSQTDRWIISMTATDATADSGTEPYYACLAASKTGNPAGPYYKAAVKLTSDLAYPFEGRWGLWVNDTLWYTAGVYCTEGLHDDATCIGSDNESGNVDGIIGNRAWAFNTADLESGAYPRWATTIGTGNASGQTFAGSAGTTGAGLADIITPASFNKATGTPPSGRNEYFTGINYADSGQRLWRASVDWSTSAITITGGAATALAQAYNAPLQGTIPALSPGNRIDDSADYVTNRVQYSNVGGTERLWTAHESCTTSNAQCNAAGGNGTPTLWWAAFDISGNNAPTVNINIRPANAVGFNPAPTNLGRFDFSVGVDKMGNTLWAYNVSNTTTGAGIRYAGRSAGAANNTMDWDEQTLISGAGYLVGTRLGDPFSAFGTMTDTVVDPDGCTFWTTGQYQKDPPAGNTLDYNNWNTRIAANANPFGGCTPTTLGTSVSSVSGTGPQGSSNASLTATLKATGTSSGIGGKTVTFKLGGNNVGSAVTNDSGVATLTGVDISSYSVGVQAGEVEASFAGAGSYNSSTNTGDLLVTGATAQAITFDLTTLPAKTFGDADFDISSYGSADSSLPVSYTATGKCTTNGAGTVVHIIGAGNCTVTARQGGDATYAPASNVDQTISIAKKDQTITFGSLASPTTVYTSAYISGSSNSNLPVDFSTNANCTTVNRTRLWGAHVGTCTVTASQPGSPDYNAATPVVQSVSIATKATMTAALSPNQGTRRVDQIDHQVSGAVTGPAGTGIYALPVDTITAANAGGWSVTAAAGASGVATLTLSPNTHAMQVGTHVNVTGMSNAAYNCSNCTLTAVAANTISYASAATGAATAPANSVTQALTVCSASGLDVTVSRTGACALTATKNATADLLAATVSATKGITKGNSGTTTFAATGSNPHPANATFDVTATLNAAATVANPEYRSSGLSPGTLTSTTLGVCTVGSTTNNNDGTATVTVTPVTNGTCTISASGNAGNDDWNNRTAQNSAATITVAKVNQTINVFDPDPIPDKQYGDPDFAVNASATSGLTVALTSQTVSVCTVTDNNDGTGTVHLVDAGTCTVSASQPGNAIYNAATNVNHTFQVTKDDQEITFDPIPDHFVDDADFGIESSSTSMLTVALASQTAGVCTVTDNNDGTGTVHLVSTGTCTVRASQAGNDQYQPALDVDRSFQVSKHDQEITFDPIGDHTIGDADFEAGATVDSPLTVSYLAEPGSVCTVTGSTVHIVGKGTCTITASQAGNYAYNAASDKVQQFTVVTAAKSTLRYIKPNKVKANTTIKVYEKVTAKGRKPSGEVKVYVDDVLMATQNYPSGKKQIIVSISPAPYSWGVGKHTVKATFKDNAGSQQVTESIKKFKVKAGGRVAPPRFRMAH
jgi:hypothetical protein